MSSEKMGQNAALQRKITEQLFGDYLEATDK